MAKAKRNILPDIFTLLIVIFPILSIYAVPGVSLPVSLGEVLIILLLPVLLINDVMKNKPIGINKYFSLYLVYALFSTLLVSLALASAFASFDVTNMVSRVIRDAFYLALVVFFGRNYFSFQKALRYMKIVSVVLVIFIVVQFLSYQIIGLYIPGFIPGVKTQISGGVISNEVSAHFLKTAQIDGYVRAHGFMSEPAVAAEYLSILLILCLFPIQGAKINYKYCIFFSLGIVLTFSLNGLVALAFCWFAWLMSTKNAILKVSVVLLVVVVVFSSQRILGVLGRLMQLTSQDSSQSSASIRVLRGFAFYFEMPAWSMIFGSGFGNFIDFKAIYGISTIYEQADEFLNTNSYVLISSGIVGFILYVYGIWRSTKGRYGCSKMLALLVFLYGFSSSIYSSAIYVIMLLFIFNCSKKEEKIYDKNYNVARYM